MIPIEPSSKSEDGSFLLDVPVEIIEIPSWLNDLSNKQRYKPKEEYHVTVIGLDMATTIHTLGKTNDVQALISRFSWTIELSTHYTELAKDDENGIHRQSIILRVRVPELVQFYAELEKILQIKFSIGPAHVTLYTKNYDRGIGLYSADDLSRFKVRDLYEE